MLQVVIYNATKMTDLSSKHFLEINGQFLKNNGQFLKKFKKNLAEYAELLQRC